MKKLLAVLFILININVHAIIQTVNVWDSATVVALRFENNAVDDVGLFTWDNKNSTPYSNTIFKYGSYSAGRFNTSNNGFVSTTIINKAIKTIEMWIYQPTGHNDSNRYYISFGSFSVQAENGMIRGNINATWLTQVPVDNDVWYRMQWTFSGTQIKQYKDGVLKSTYDNGSVPQNAVCTVGNHSSLTTGIDAYLDNVTLSTIDRGGVENTPISVSEITVYPQQDMIYLDKNMTP